MSYFSRWLTKADMTRIERINDLPAGTLQVDTSEDKKLEGAYVSNALNKIRDPELRHRAEAWIEMFFE